MSFTSPQVLYLLPIILGGTVWLWAGRTHGHRTPRRVLSLCLRLLIFTALILAGAGATLVRPRSAEAVTFVGDVSASTGPGQPSMVQFIDRALKHRARDDQAALVAVGRSAIVEQPPAALTGLQHFESVVDPSYTNLESGLSLGAALLPSGYRRRVVLLSDGRENLGDAVSEAQLLRSEGIRVDVAPISFKQGPEVRVDSLTVPSSLHRGERFTIEAQVASTVQTSTTYQLLEDGRLLASGSATLPVGVTTVGHPVEARSAGIHTYTFIIQPQLDTLSQNNQASAFATVSGPPTVLIVEGASGSGR
ncbi:MAG: hypothetical protein JWO42_3063, partial [Chloroflexi bacterium]|nr:hypothetical protein [Chloroflexota bacterium]